jgi:anti-sigma regulatory factor (Ser/Thr protein kinase)
MREITILNRGSELTHVAALLDHIGAERHLLPEMLADMHIALDEVLSNIMKYAYSDDAEHKIHIRLRVLDNFLEAEIKDDGVPFNPLAILAPDVSTPLRDRRVGGVGIHFVAQLMDDVAYIREDECNRLVLRKRTQHISGAQNGFA